MSNDESQPSSGGGHLSSTAITVGIQLTLMDGGYARLFDAWHEAEAEGVDYIFVSDHFVTVSDHPEPTYEQLHGPTFEAQSILAAIAATTTRVELGALVLGAGFRNPNLVADMSRTIDHVSGGRHVLGLGAGYYQLDYDEYGYPFGSLSSRSADFSQYVPAVVSRLQRLNPPPLRRIPIMIGGSGERVTLQLVAKYADMWNVGGDGETLRRKSMILDDWCHKVGRDPGDIVRSTWIGEWDGAPSPDEVLDLGFSSLICRATGPDWNLDGLRQLMSWKRAQSH